MRRTDIPDRAYSENLLYLHFARIKPRFFVLMVPSSGGRSVSPAGRWTAGSCQNQHTSRRMFALSEVRTYQQ